MTSADEYQRECERVLLDLSWPIEDATEAAQALAADPGVRAAVEREARAEAWDEGEAAGAEYESRRSSEDPDDWDGLELPTNPYRQEPSDG